MPSKFLITSNTSGRSLGSSSAFLGQSSTLENTNDFSQNLLWNQGSHARILHGLTTSNTSGISRKYFSVQEGAFTQ